jgi:glucokinase
MTVEQMAGSPIVDPMLGVDLGGTKITAGLVLPGGRLAHVVTTATPARAGRQAVLDALLGLLGQVRGRAAAAGDADAKAVGIGSAGVIDPRTGAVTAATEHITGWAGTPLAQHVASAVGLPTRALNDVHAHALGEARFGAGRGLGTLLLVAAGTGLEGALVVNGTVLTGHHGVAGHLGHVPAEPARGLRCACGRVGHLESVASGPGLLALYRRRGGHAARAEDVAESARTGDPLATACLTLTGRALGHAIGGWVNVIDPDAVIVTGGLGDSGPLWWDALGRAAYEQCVDTVRACPVLPAELGARAAVLGAAAHAATVLHRSVHV